MPSADSPDDAAAQTAAAREQFLSRFEDEDDRSRYFAELGRKSGEARRERSAALDDLLKRTRTDRGLALVIEDPATIAKVAAVLAAEGGDAS